MLVARRISRKNLRDTEFRSKTLSVSRVSKTTTGGRRMSIATLVVIGDENGNIGYGLGGAMEVRDAEQKAFKIAQNNLFSIPIKRLKGVNSDASKTIYHKTSGKYCASKVLIIPGKPGTGVIAGPVMRSVFQCLGLTDVVAKSHGSNNPHNILKATLDALMKIKSSNYYKQIHKLSLNA